MYKIYHTSNYYMWRKNMSYKSDSNKTERNCFTRMCIGEALINLMQQKEYKSIKISDIVERAGISRMTYYNYYHSKTDILEDYLQELVGDYIRSANAEENKNKIGGFQDYEHILHALNFFDQYADFFLTLVRADLYSVIIDAIDLFMEEQILPVYPRSVYRLYCYAGALLHTFIKWEEHGKKESVEEIANIIVSFVRNYEDIEE